MAFIEVRKLTSRYKRYVNEKESLSLTALDEADLSINKGQFVAISGPNGSGKSTLARHLCALIMPAGGEVTVDGLSAAAPENANLIHKKAGIIFQNPDNQIVGNTLEEDVAFGLENLGTSSEEMDRRIDEVLAGVGMKDMRKMNPAHLSGGQKQKLVIASVLAMEPECIVLDEPLSMIDPESRQDILSMIYALNREKKLTMIYITQQIEEAREADLIYIMDAGKVAACGKPREILSDPGLLEDHGLVCQIEKKKSRFLPVRNPQKGIRLEGVSFTYPNQQNKAIRDISLQVSPGEAVAILGKTGSGKSTLLQLMDGLLRPGEGEIFFDGKKILEKECPGKELHQRIGYSFQYPDYQLFEETVIKDVAFGPANMGYRPEEAKELAVKALDLVGFPEVLMDHSPLALSGGEKRRAAIAGSLAAQPEFLLLDEPTAGLDGRGIRKLFELLALLQERGRGIVFVTHEPSYAELFADRVLVIDEGSLIYDGSPDDLPKGVWKCSGR